MPKETYGLKKKVKFGDKIVLEDGTEIIIEKSLGGSWLSLNLVIPEGKKFTYIKGERNGSEEKSA